MVQRRTALVLGAGVARGWAHIGVIKRLAELGIEPDIVCGCSSGAIVGASYVTGRLDALADRVMRLNRREILGHLDISFAGGGLVEGRGLLAFFRDTIGDVAIEDVTPTFGVVATELHTGRELWLTSGSLIDAVRASIALPGLITPLHLRGRWLVDGALVNPLPVSLARALGADVIIGVTLNGALVSPPVRASRLAAPPADPPPPAPSDGGEAGGTTPAAPSPSDAPPGADGAQSSWLRWVSLGLPLGLRSVVPSTLPLARRAPAHAMPSRPTYFEVMTESFFAVQNFVSRVRLAADPVDVLIAPRVAGIGLVDFHRGRDAIEAGRAAVDEVEAALRVRLGR